jgi:hypothetical protein
VSFDHKKEKINDEKKLHDIKEKSYGAYHELALLSAHFALLFFATPRDFFPFDIGLSYICFGFFREKKLMIVSYIFQVPPHSGGKESLLHAHMPSR